MVQRLESGLTGRGIPDLYLIYNDQDIWVELKNDKVQLLKQDEYEIDWRKGQQAWALKYLNAHRHKRWTYTVASLKDGFLIIPMRQRYVRNIVAAHDCYKGEVLGDIIQAISIEQSKING
jgi:hypothetical protein